MEIKPFLDISGNDHIKEYLTRIFENNRVGQSLLFSGPESAEKVRFALAFAHLLLGASKDHHPDLHMYRPEGKSAMHSIESMRRFSDDVYLSPYESNRKVFIIDDADRMLATSANALLKTFEEPSKESVIILVSSKPDRLLPTIISRCQIVRFHEVKSKDSDDDKNCQNLIKFLSEGSFINYSNLTRFAKSVSEEIEGEKKEVEEQLIDEMLQTFKEKATASQKEAIRKEIEGIVSVRMKDKVKEFFNTILFWYRDMQLISLNGKSEYLLLPEFKKVIHQALQNGNLISLDKFQKLLNETLITYERSTPLAHCIESFFLQMQKLRVKSDPASF